MNIARHLVDGARCYPDRAVLVFESQSISYGELEERTNRAAHGFIQLGVGKGDRVAIWLPNIPEFVVAYIGILKIGAIAVSLDAGLKPEEAEFILEDSSAFALLTTPDMHRDMVGRDLPHLRHILVAGGSSTEAVSFAEAMECAPAKPYCADMGEDDPAAILYTSGTTGFPKGATLSHGNVRSNIESKCAYLGIRQDDRMLLFLPMNHCFGQNAVLNSGMYAGATIVLHRQFEIDPILDSIKKNRITMFFGTPTTYLLLYDKASTQRLDSIRYYFSAAAKLPEYVEDQWRQKFGAVIYQGYGLTETSPFCSYNHLEEYRSGSIGAPIDGVEMKIVDVESGRDALPGEQGEIVVRGPNVMLGYWNRPIETAEVIRNGWLHTGDIGRMDEKGYFYIEDRLKDMVNVGGLKVYPAEVENTILHHPSVAEVAVFGVPDTLLGEQVKARIVLKPDCEADAAGIINFCNGKLAGYKIPRSIEFGSIPRSVTGKILKRVLKGEPYSPLVVDKSSEGQLSFQRRPPAEPSSQSTHVSEEIRAWLNNWLMRQLDVKSSLLDSRRPLSSYGLDSVMSVELARELGTWLGVPLADTLVWSFPTIEALISYLGDMQKAGTGDAQSRSGRSLEWLGWEGQRAGVEEQAKILADEIAAIRRLKTGR